MESEEVGQGTTARNRKPNITLDMEGVLSEKLRSLKNTRRGHLANVTANVNGVHELLSDDRNLQEVKEKLTAAEEAFLKFKDAHVNYAAEIGSEEDKIECEEYFTCEERKFRDFYWTTSDWITRVEANLVAQSLQVDSEVKPEDSVSCAGVGSPARASRTSKRSSRASSRVSRISSLFVARAKEAARVAELKAERSMLDKRQVLEEQKFRLKQEELRLNLEAEIVKTVAKEQALAAIAEQSSLSVSPKPVKREDEFHEEEEFKPPPVVDRTVLNPKAPEWTRSQAANPDCGIRPIYPEVPVARGTAFDSSTKLQEQQNALQLQQTRIMEMLAINQNKGKLPQPRVPTFDGNPVEYRTFVRAFESLIESRTSSSTERLYYLEQYTAGDVKELVRSCHHLAPDEGYAEARRLIEKKFGDDFRIASAYESKALNWPPVKSEDGSALSRFSVYLASCKNAMKGSQYSSKFDQPDNIQKLIFKLPYNMRERWRRVVDDIMELQGRPVKFDDLVSFIDREARIATNPVFGQITESSKILEARSSRGAVQKLLPKSRELSLAAQVNTDHGLDTEVNRSIISTDNSQYAPSIAPVSNSCCFCNLNHALEDCRSLRSRPYQERIQFIASKSLCFGCLSDKHIVKDCPQRKSCKFTNCPKKHPTVLHTQPRERLNGETSADSADNASCSATQVHNGMVSTIDNSCSVTGAGRPRTGMAIVPVKVKRKGSDDAIVTYAFLDNGSSSTFCTESLMKQLGIEGLRTRISLTTLEKKGSLVDSFLVEDLVISDLDENNFISLPVLYTRTEIPVTKDDIPTQEDADLWPHLNGVYLPNVSAEIGLLIASDVPEALDPLEVKNSEHGGPYASRTRIGWVVNGPLGRYHQASHATSFFVKADTELQRMVEDFYNLGFNESVADNRTELSQDERRFMASVEGSTLLKDGHYEIPLPFKDRQYSVPNNRIQAEQRASWLEKRLEKNPRLLDHLIKGPAFLWEQKARWPQEPLSLDSISDADPVVKVDVNVHATVAAVPFCPVVEYFRRTSSWHRLKKSVAWFLWYRENLRLASTRRKLAVSSPNTPCRRINMEEMKAAELQILKCVQLHYFSERLQSLTKAGVDAAHVKKSSGLLSLHPVLVNGLLRVGGRLDLAPASFDSKHQIILPKSDHVSTLIIEHCHLISGHSGREYVLSLLREKFWIVKASSAVRRVLSKCVSCRRRQRPVCEQKMADLPVDRLTPDQPPFTSVGVDYFGPFQIKRGRSLVKRYGVISACLAIRAVHIEVAHSLDTDSFPLALKRFIARRGQGKEIRSDNGTNFSSGEKELRESMNVWNQEKIHENLLQRNIKWSFNLPYGWHYGGVWERCIRTTRKILQALLREQTTDDEGLYFTVRGGEHYEWTSNHDSL